MTETKTKKFTSQYLTEELRAILGDFEQEYNARCLGEKVNNPILGKTYQGIVDWCVENKAMAQRERDWAVCYANYEYWWRPKYEAMRELQSRRAYAQKKNLEFLEAETEKKEIDVMTMF